MIVKFNHFPNFRGENKKTKIFKTTHLVNVSILDFLLNTGTVPGLDGLFYSISPSDVYLPFTRVDL